MKTKHFAASALLSFVTSMACFAQDTDHFWSKSYSLTGEPTLTFETSDASVAFHSCGGCRTIRIQVELEGRKLNDYRLEEGQSGDHVHFFLKELPHVGGHISWHREQTKVTVETPAQLTLQARTSDGNVVANGLTGDLSLTTGDGNLEIDHVSGSLRIQSGDGRVIVSNADGAIDAHTSDGDMNVDGKFHALALHTSDGKLNLHLREGTKLAAASSIRSSDGSVTLHLPADFAADLDVHTSDGHVDCSLPIAVEHYQSNGGAQLQGKVNVGGAPLTISTSDGNVSIDQI